MAHSTAHLRLKALGLTQEALAELVAAGRSAVVRWERGESEPLPSIPPRLARATQRQSRYADVLGRAEKALRLR